MNQNDINRSLQQYLNDLDKQVRALQRLEYAPTTNVVTYSGTPAAGQMTVWTGQGTVAGGTAVATVIQAIGDARYLPGSGTYTSGNVIITNYSEDVADITSTQALTIQVTSGAARRLHITHFDVALARAATNNVFGYFTGWVAWTWGTGGTTIIRGYDVSHATSGTDACTLTTIANGIQVVVASSAFGNTMDANALFVHNVSETPVAVATSIA